MLVPNDIFDGELGLYRGEQPGKSIPSLVRISSNQRQLGGPTNYCFDSLNRG